MSKPYLLLVILLTIAFSGCIIKADPGDNSTVSPDVTATDTTNQTQAKITATATPIIIPTPTPTLIVLEHENSTVYVTIKGSEFKPSELRVMKGTIVKWKNMDDAQYIINGTDFVSPPLNKRDVWSYTFNKTGTFEYNCTIHSWMQHGHIIVE
jgi:plastocyanin